MRKNHTFLLPAAALLAITATLSACGASPDDAAAHAASGTGGTSSFADPAAAAPSPAATTASDPSGSTSGTNAAASGSTATPSSPSTTTTSSGRLVAYWASWTRGTLPPSQIAWSKVTHVAHAFVSPDAAGGLKSVDAYVDAELLSQAHAHGVKVVASVGGAGANFSFASDPNARAATVAAMVDLCKRGYDGIDIDWEFPDASNVAYWTSLVTETRAALSAANPALTLSAAVGSGAHLGADLLPQAAVDALDWIGVMSYDFAGPWSKSSGHDSPLYPTAGGDGGSVSESIGSLVSGRHVQSSKVLVGLPFYGYQFGASQLASTPVSPSSAMDYRDIAAIPASEGWADQWDATGNVPYRTRAASPGFLSFDDARSIGSKCSYAKGAALGGAIVWHLAGDRLPDGTQPLLDAAQACR